MSNNNNGVQVVFGCTAVTPGRGFGSVEAVQEAFDALDESGCTALDTARFYGDSEEILGKAGAGKRFVVNTKARGGFHPDGGGTKANILDDAGVSREFLGSDGHIDIYYLHAPSRDVPLEETLSGIDEVYRSGFFRRFGLSNYSAEDVEKVYDLCKEKGYVLPSVYQGCYSAVARKQEKLLFPTLRKLGMAFYAYSPLAGGYLTKTKRQIHDGAGRFTADQFKGVYKNMYARPTLIEALDDWHGIAREEGCTAADLAYRWVRYNSALRPEHGDAIIVGASSLQQLRQTMSSIDGGPLSANAVERIDGIWKKIEHEAPVDNFEEFVKN